MTTHPPMFGQPLADSLRLAIEGTLNDGFQIATELAAWRVEKGPLALESYIIATIAMQQQEAQRKAPWGLFIVALSRETILKALTTYGVTDTANPAVIDDAAGEIANMIYGMLKTSINKMGYHFVMEIPSPVHRARDITDRCKSAEKMVVPFLAGGHECRIVVAQAA